jgi:hypothetical protein
MAEGQAFPAPEGRKVAADMVAKRSAIELLEAAEAMVWTDTFTVSGAQVEALAVAALTFAFAVKAANWRVEATDCPGGSSPGAPPTSAVVDAVMTRLIWLDGGTDDPPMEPLPTRRVARRAPTSPAAPPLADPVQAPSTEGGSDATRLLPDQRWPSKRRRPL